METYEDKEFGLNIPQRKFLTQILGKSHGWLIKGWGHDVYNRLSDILWKDKYFERDKGILNEVRIAWLEGYKP